MVSFLFLCKSLDTIQNARSEEIKKEILLKLLKDCQIFNNGDIERIFSILRLLLPENDKTRRSYGIKEHTIGKIITNFFNIDQNSEDYKQINVNLFPEIYRNKDYSVVIFQIANKHSHTATAELSIADLNNYLSEMSEEAHSSIVFRNLLNLTTSLEIKWIIRIILKEVKLGLDSEDILSLYNPRAVHFFKHNNDLLNIITCVAQGVASDVQTDLLHFIRPMLSKKSDRKLFTKINIKGYLVEEKYDGERFQFHYNKPNQFKWFSRTGNSYDQEYESLSDRVIGCFTDGVDNIILDGEMMGYDAKTGKYGAKGYNYDIKKPKETRKYQPCFQVFDIMFYNNCSLLNTSLRERRRILDRVLSREYAGVIVKSRINILKDMEDVVERLNTSMDMEWEGIVIKDPESVYTPNQRTDSWIKVKAEYFDNLLTELDLLIVGGYYGKKRNQRSGISSFLVAVLHEHNDRKEFLTVSQSGLGLTNRELQKLQFRLMAHWQKRTKTNCPRNIRCGTEQPDLWIDPEKSLILEMKASELQFSKSYATTHTLRFPRMVKVRYDKPWDGCTTLNEYEEIVIARRREPVVKLFKRRATINDLVIQKETPALPIFAPKSVIYERKSDKLSNKEFIVLTGSEEISKENVEQLILEHGGSLGNMYSENTYCMIAGIINYYVDLEIKQQVKNVIKLDWLLRELNSEYSGGELSEWRPMDMYSLNERNKVQMNKNYDEFGDHFTVHATTESLKLCVEYMNSKQSAF